MFRDFLQYACLFCILKDLIDRIGNLTDSTVNIFLEKAAIPLLQYAFSAKSNHACTAACQSDKNQQMYKTFQECTPDSHQTGSAGWIICICLRSCTFRTILALWRYRCLSLLRLWRFGKLRCCLFCLLRSRFRCQCAFLSGHFLIFISTGVLLITRCHFYRDPAFSGTVNFHPRMCLCIRYLCRIAISIFRKLLRCHHISGNISRRHTKQTEHQRCCCRIMNTVSFFLVKEKIFCKIPIRRNLFQIHAVRTSFLHIPDHKVNNLLHGLQILLFTVRTQTIQSFHRNFQIFFRHIFPVSALDL